MIVVIKKKEDFSMENHLNSYQIFVTVARLGNISAASKELYISQPAISKAIANLEDSLGTKLFIRNSRGVKLTEEGQILYPQIATGLTAIHHGEEQLKTYTKMGYGHLSIGVSTTLCKFVLLPVLQAFVQEHPHIQITIENQSSIHTFDSLSSSTVDIGLVGAPESSSMEFLPVMEISDTLVTTDSYLAALHDRQKQDPDSRATLMLLGRDNLTRQYVDRYLSGSRLFNEQTLEVSSMDLLIEFAKINLGVACVIENFVTRELREGTLVHFPSAPQIPKRKIGFAWPTQTNPNPSFHTFLAFIKEHPEYLSSCC